MDTSQASTETAENADVQNVKKSDEPGVCRAKLELMVTPEQVLSASVARRRRTLTKKQSNRARDQTPGRDAVVETTTDEEAQRDTRPKTPERRRRKSNRVSSASIERSESLTLPERSSESVEKAQAAPLTKTASSGAIVAKSSEPKKKDSLVNITQAEVLALFNKAKRSLASGRERIKQKKAEKAAYKRSLSAPSQFENELLEGLRKAQLLDDNHARKASYQGISSDSSEVSSLYEERPKPKPYRPVVQRFMAKKRQQRQQSAKVIEILDPKTSKVIGTVMRGIPQPKMRFSSFFIILRYLTIIDMYKVYKAFKRERRRECDKIAKLRNKCINDLVVILIFCGLGGIMFKYVEGAFENFYKCGVKRVKRDFIDVLWYRSHNMREEEWKSLARTKLRTFEEELHVAHEAGMHSYSGQKSWSFLNGIVYCLTIVTTIGYGHMYPTTRTGMALTIVYSIIGIPMFLIALTDFGKLFTRAIKFVWSFVRRLYYTGSCRRARQTAHMEDILQGAQMMYEIATLRRPSMFVSAEPAALEEDPENPKNPDGTLNSAGIGSDTPTTPAPSNFEIDDEFNLPISVAIFILVLYIFLGAVMYWSLETEWDFFAAFYFVFISMSTIGFGDYVPKHPVCMLASIVYLVFGLALMSMCINVVQVKLSDTFKDASAKLGATIGLGVEEEEEEEEENGNFSVTTPTEVPDVHVESKEDEKKDKDKNKNGTKKEKKSSMKIKTQDESKDKEDDGDKPKTTKEVKF